MENNKKKIDKKKIVKYVGATLIAVSLISGIGIYNAQVDHTKEVSSDTYVEDTVNNDTYSDSNETFTHHKEVNKGIGEKKSIVAPIEKKVENGEGIHTLSWGYVLTQDENGQLVGEKLFIKPIKKLQVNGEIIYYLPRDYVLTQDENGQMVEEKVVKDSESLTRTR